MKNVNPSPNPEFEIEDVVVINYSEHPQLSQRGDEGETGIIKAISIDDKSNIFSHYELSMSSTTDSGLYYLVDFGDDQYVYPESFLRHKVVIKTSDK